MGIGGDSVGGQISFGGNAGISLFVAYDTHKETDPASFADKSYAVSVSADIKAIVSEGCQSPDFLLLRILVMKDGKGYQLV